MLIPVSPRCQLEIPREAILRKRLKQITQRRAVTFFSNFGDIHIKFIDTGRFLFCALLYMAIDGPLKIDREEGKNPGTLIVRLAGPLTLRNIFDLQSQLRNAKPTPVTILDLTDVPYMDSAGMGVVVNYHVHCQNLGGRLSAVGVSPRIMELFKITKVDSVIRMAPTLEEAEALV
jgi:anti-sigma B factor antagonist